MRRMEKRNIGMAPAMKNQAADPDREHQNICRCFSCPDAKVDQRDTNAVQSVQDHGSEQPNFPSLKSRAVEETHGLVESSRPLAQLVDREHVQKQIEQQEQAA